MKYVINCWEGREGGRDVLNVYFVQLLNRFPQVSLDVVFKIVRKHLEEVGNVKAEVVHVLA